MPPRPVHHQPAILKATVRKALQGKGQFWTPQWVARAMVQYPLGAGIAEIFDPALGAGAFFRAARAVGADLGLTPVLRGAELHAEVLAEARAEGLSPDDLAGVRVGDFMTYPFAAPVPAIVANPPYLRHHRIGAQKLALMAMARAALGAPMDGRAGLHVYFLIRCLQHLAPGGRLAFLMPADTCEGVFAPALWRWISTTFRLEAVVTFAPEATPFPGVDTNAVLFCIRHAPPAPSVAWARWTRPGPALERWVRDGFPAKHDADAVVTGRPLAEAIETGLSRPPVAAVAGRPLGDYARVVRGIATGDNAFFFLTSAQVQAHRLPADALVRAVGRTRDVTRSVLTGADLAALDRAGRPTYLVSLDGTPEAALPAPVRAYLALGRARGVPERTLVATRTPWYRMERREAPSFLFAYLGRSDVRFIQNTAGVRPLTGFLCVYPRDPDPAHVARLWTALQDPATVANLSRVGKSYGDGAIKVEPRALERLVIPDHVLQAAGLL